MLLLFFVFAFSSKGNAYSWEEGAYLPLTGLDNPYNLNPQDLEKFRHAGLYHSLNYPVTVTGALLPLKPIERFFNGDNKNPLRKILEKIFHRASPFKSFEEFLNWLGLHPYPDEEGDGPYFVPFAPYKHALATPPSTHMGLTIMNRHGEKGFTFSCAHCHSSNLFGQKVMGLQNRFPRANHVFVLGDRGLRAVPSRVFAASTDATDFERLMYKETRRNMLFVKAKRPQSLGLDTSLAHVALSLSHRKKDAWATKSRLNARFPRHEMLNHFVSDSKPGTWWNVKYKNKWLLDGSVVSGNPILTNILWNELGRGTDLLELEQWLSENEHVVAELTTAVYQSEAPHITDFFPEEYFDFESIKRGQKVYEKMECFKCHGQYHKNWDFPQAATLSFSDLLKTHTVEYFEDTPVKNVGTDPHRYLATQSLIQLNDLKISKNKDAKIKLQDGYVPPPLVGIWARWPYFHNNSAPSLCEVLTPETRRVPYYWSGPANDPNIDFDFDCNGYPMGAKTPTQWQTSEFYFSTKKPGQWNKGHSDRILVKDGKERLTPQDKRDLIRFLQTL